MPGQTGPRPAARAPSRRSRRTAARDAGPGDGRDRPAARPPAVSAGAEPIRPSGRDPAVAAPARRSRGGDDRRRPASGPSPGSSAPVLLALVVVVALAPVQGWLQRIGVPRWLATTVLLLLVWAVLLAFVALLVVSAAQFAALLPDYAGQAEILISQVVADLNDAGLVSGQLSDLVRQIDYGQLVGLATGLLGQLTSAASTLVLLLSALVFMSIESSGFARRMALVGCRAPAPAGRHDALRPGHPQLPAGQHRLRRDRGRRRLDRADDHRGAGRGAVGAARVRHQLRAQHRVRPGRRARPRSSACWPAAGASSPRSSSSTRC